MNQCYLWIIGADRQDHIKTLIKSCLVYDCTVPHHLCNKPLLLLLTYSEMLVLNGDRLCLQNMPMSLCLQNMPNLGARHTLRLYQNFLLLNFHSSKSFYKKSTFRVCFTSPSALRPKGLSTTKHPIALLWMGNK